MFEPEIKAATEEKDDEVVELEVQQAVTVKTHTSVSLETFSDIKENGQEAKFLSNRKSKLRVRSSVVFHLIQNQAHPPKRNLVKRQPRSPPPPHQIIY
jgi:hypothetical protein